MKWGVNFFIPDSRRVVLGPHVVAGTPWHKRCGGASENNLKSRVCAVFEKGGAKLSFVIDGPGQARYGN